MIMYRHPGLKIDIEDKSGPSPIIKNSPERDKALHLSDKYNIRDSVVINKFFKEDKNNGSDNNDGNKEG